MILDVRKVADEIGAKVAKARTEFQHLLSRTVAKVETVHHGFAKLIVCDMEAGLVCVLLGRTPI